MRGQLRLLVVAVSCASAQLVKDWRAVETPHFELVSRYDPAKVGALVEDLEWARAIFETNFGLKSRLDRKALILVPDSPYDYEQLSPSKQSGGYYLAAPWRDIILLKELFNARHGLLHHRRRKPRRACGSDQAHSPGGPRRGTRDAGGLTTPCARNSRC